MMAQAGRWKRRGGEAASTWLMVAVILAVVASIAYFNLKNASIPSDEKTLCPEDEKHIPHHAVLLFERNRRADPETDEFNPFPANTVTEIQQKIEKRVLQNLPTRALVEIYEVNYDRDKPFVPVARFCNPGRGSHFNKWTGNPRLAEQRYREKFLKPVQSEVDRLSRWSPDYRYSLVDSLGGVARLVFSNPKFEHADKSLTVVSDFVVPENFAKPGSIPKSFSEVDMSMKLGKYEDFANARRARYDFRGAVVRMIATRMAYKTIPYIQGAAHVQWWGRFFTSQNAKLKEFVQVGE